MEIISDSYSCSTIVIWHNYIPILSPHDLAHFKGVKAELSFRRSASDFSLMQSHAFNISGFTFICIVSVWYVFCKDWTLIDQVMGQFTLEKFTKGGSRGVYT